MSQFVHLHLHSEYSMVDGIVRIKPLMAACQQFNISAIAVTDMCNLFAAVKTYKGAIGAGLKPIIAAELTLLADIEEAYSYQIVALCQNEIGYRHLTELISRAYQEGQQKDSLIIKPQWLLEKNEGLIILAGFRSDIAWWLQKSKTDEASVRLEWWLKHFGDRFYIELSRTNRVKEREFEMAILPLVETFELPIVATNDVRFLNQQDFEAHEARVCIHDGYLLEDDNRPKNYSEEQYLKSPQQMQELFFDLPEAIENTLEIAKRCTTTIELGKNYLPDFPVPEGMGIDDYLRQHAQEGLEERLTILFKDHSEEEFQTARKAYDERLKVELDVIINMGFPGYFLIVADFISWAKDNGVPVGPGRGSGAGSLVAYALKITDLDPLEYDLLFERFLNPERVSMPDFDIDFCMDGRDRVIEYVAQTYGRQSVSQIITFGSMAAKAVVRDVGRVLGMPYSFVDKISKLIPFEIGITLSKALEQEETLRERYESETEVFELLELAKKLEGITRNAGKHAGGVVIAPGKLTDFTAIYCEPESTQLVTQFDKDDVEAAGLVKFDFLGLRTLTIIDWALKSVVETQQETVDIALIDLDDTQSFDLLKACQTTAVFQLESRGMKDLIHRLQPDCFEDIVALVALFRPGPLQSGMVDDFIDRKHGRAKVIYPHPDLEPILKPTYGVILYQEQVMQIAQVLAGYTLGAADMLRRAMGKKKPEEMAKQREIFTKGSVERGVEEETATYIFDLMEKFAGYGFNKSHSAAYALVAYQTAWLKAHYPAPFMSAVLSSDMDNTDKVVTFIQECNQMKIEIYPPCINASEYQFKAQTTPAIRYGLGAIKGVGEAAIELICQARASEGAFSSLFDFCQRLDLRKVNRRVIEALIKAGAMDTFKVGRAQLMLTIEKALKLADKAQANMAMGQQDLFSEEINEEVYLPAKDWNLKQSLEGERETLGLYFSGHPVDQYQQEMQTLVKTRIGSLHPSSHKTALIMGLVTGVRRLLTKKEKKMAVVSLDDNTGRVDVAVFQETLEECDELLEKDRVIAIEGEISHDEFSGGIKMAAKKVLDMQSIRKIYGKRLNISLNHHDQPKLEQLEQNFKAYPGEIPVLIQYTNQELTVPIRLSSNFDVSADDSCLQDFRDLLGVEAVKFI